MSIVCNAGPLIALAGIGQLGLLRDLFDEVPVADDVKSESMYWKSLFHRRGAEEE